MTNNSSNSTSSNKAKLQSLKTEVASSLNVNLKQGYNGDITAREAGSIGGEMVKRMIAYAEMIRSRPASFSIRPSSSRSSPGYRRVFNFRHPLRKSA